MAIKMVAIKCPHCGAPDGLEKVEIGRYKCKYCDCTCLSSGEDEQSMVILLSEKRWKELHDIVKANGADETLLEVQLELNKSFPINLEAEIQNIDVKGANTIKTEITALSSELATFSDKGKTWNRLAEVVLRVVFCRSLIGDFNTVVHVMSDIKECNAVTPRSWVKLYKNYYMSSRSDAKDLSVLLSVNRIKESLRDKNGKYDELAFFEFADYLAQTADNAQFKEFFIDFINATLDDQEFVKEVYPTGQLFKHATLRKHVKALNKAFIQFSKEIEGGKR